MPTKTPNTNQHVPLHMRAIEDLLDLAQSYLDGSLFATEEEILDTLDIAYHCGKIPEKFNDADLRLIAHALLNQIPIERREK